jgi:hypothetical protein
VVTLLVGWLVGCLLACLFAFLVVWLAICFLTCFVTYSVRWRFAIVLAEFGLRLFSWLIDSLGYFNI